VLALQINQKSISMPQDRNRFKEKRVGVLRSQVCQLSSLPTRWCMVVRSSHDAHMISGGGHVTQGHGVCSNWDFHGDALCNGERSMEWDQVWSGLNSVGVIGEHDAVG